MERGLIWTEKSPVPKAQQEGDAPAEGILIADGDFRIQAVSPEPTQAHIQTTVHCFVREGVWMESEICEVRNLKTGVVLYSTEDTPLERALKQKALDNRKQG